MKTVKRVGSFLLALLRELGDESAYRRHLAAHGRAHSRREWQRFCDQRFSAKFIRPKCC